MPSKQREGQHVAIIMDGNGLDSGRDHHAQHFTGRLQRRTIAARVKRKRARWYLPAR
jgi:undecaprenyl pyrophosphate synthase